MVEDTLKKLVSHVKCKRCSDMYGIDYKTPTHLIRARKKGVCSHNNVIMNSSGTLPKVLTYGYQVKQWMISKRFQTCISTQPKQSQLGIIIIKSARVQSKKSLRLLNWLLMMTLHALCNQQRRREGISVDLDPNDKEMTHCDGSPWLQKGLVF